MNEPTLAEVLAGVEAVIAVTDATTDVRIRAALDLTAASLRELAAAPGRSATHQHLVGIFARARGGHHYARVIEAVLAKLTPSEGEELYRAVRAVHDSAEDEGEHKAKRRFPWMP